MNPKQLPFTGKLNTIKCLIFTLACLTLLSAHAEEPISSYIDCTDIELKYIDNLELTKAEQLALMEKAFYDSLSHFELCNLSTQLSSSSQNSEESGSSAEATSEKDSIASDALAGTEPVAEPTLSSATSTAISEQQPDASNIGPSSSTNTGVLPKDIPSADNDDVIAAQIRLAAETETDPEIREKLWDEYRKYKGVNIE